MSNYVNDALLDASPYKKQQEETKGLVQKWDKTGLLDGLNEEFQKNGMAVMLENQAKQLIQENSATGGGAGSGTAGTAGSDIEYGSRLNPFLYCGVIFIILETCGF